MVNEIRDFPDAKFNVRFWTKIDRSGSCWNWVAAHNGVGYGVIGVGGRMRLAHRLVFELFNGPIPPGGYVCHKCDIPSCCNPDHLFLGDAASNMTDMASKGRSPSGHRHYNTRLMDHQVAEIRARYAAGGITKTQLATEYGVTKGHVGDIISGKKRKGA